MLQLMMLQRQNVEKAAAVNVVDESSRVDDLRARETVLDGSHDPVFIDFYTAYTLSHLSALGYLRLQQFL